MIKILIVDDHKLVRKGITSLLNDVQGIQIVGEASNGEESLRLVREIRPDVILMDIQMPGMGGMEATRKILRQYPDVKILILTLYDNDIFPARLLEEGAAGYLTKGSHPDEMVRAIRAVSSGQRYISPEVAQKLALRRYHSEHKRTPVDQLSERELQVMIMITEGKKPQEIADVLHLSPKTINTYRYRLFDKMGVKSDVELTHVALRHGLINKGQVD